MNYFVRSSAIEGYEKLVYQLGANPQSLLSEAGISSAQLRKPEALVSYVRVADLLDITAIETKDPFFSLRLASTQQVTALGDLLMLSSQQVTLQSALETLLKHIRIHANGLHLTPLTLDKLTQIAITYEFSNASGLVQLNQLSAAQAFNAARTLMGGDARKIRIALTQHEPSVHYRPVETLHKSILFNSRFDGIQFPTAALGNKTAQDATVIKEYLGKKMKLLEDLYPQDIKAQVGHIITDLLSSNECSIERVASTLNVSPRVLQKKLQEQGTRFSDILQETRLRLAIQLLETNSFTIEEIALNLGYAETAVFSRSFKAWTGYSPKQWLKRH